MNIKTRTLSPQDELGSRSIYGSRELAAQSGPSNLSVFSDDIWDLTPLNQQEHLRSVTLHFLTLPSRHVLVGKELFFALLALEQPAGEPLLSPTTIRKHFGGFKKFTLWMEANGLERLDSLTPEDLDAYSRDLALEFPLGIDSQYKYLRIVRLIYLYSEKLNADRLSFDPNRQVGWRLGRGDLRSRSENSTERIPGPVLQPLISWATRWTTEFGADVLLAMAEFSSIRMKDPKRKVTGARDTAQAIENVRALIGSYETEKRRLPKKDVAGPDLTPQVNLSHLAREADCKMDVVQRAARQLIRDATDRLGLDTGTYLRVKPQGMVAGDVWMERISYSDLPALVDLLTSACYIITAFYSGMRDAELKHLKRGCLSEITDASGTIKQLRLTGLAFKGEASRSGVPATWVVGSEVATAVAMLEAIQPKSEQYLFAPSKIPLTGRRQRKYRNGAVTNTQTNRMVNKFSDWVSSYCAKRGLDEVIPLVNSTKWTFATSQFRRTLAWFIARRPGGSIAGAIQFRHRSVQMFEGYAGTSKSGFRAEVESEAAMARGEYLLQSPTGHEHSTFSGPAKHELEKRLHSFRAQARFEGLIADNPRQLKKILARHEPGVYPGEFVTCVFNPEKALCLRGEFATAPDLNGCQPTRCRNVALDAGQRSEWEQRLRNLDEQLAEPSQLNPYVLSKLSGIRAHIERLLRAAEGSE